MVIYNIEKFIFEEMFLPYMDLLLSLSSEDFTLSTQQWKHKYKAEIFDIKAKINNNPSYIFDILNDKPDVKQLVIERLQKLNIKFYKYLECEFINQCVKEGIIKKC